jgi:hypothetical protein
MSISTGTAGSSVADGKIALPERFNKQHHMWWLGALIAVSVFGVLVGTAFRDTLTTFIPETVPNLSTYNKKASGYSALFELAEKLKLDVRRWQAPYRMLSADKVTGTLVILSPWDTPSASEAEMLERWVEEGNDLVFLDDFSLGSTRTMSKLAGVSPRSTRVAKDISATPDPTLDESAFVGKVKVLTDARVDGGTPVAFDSEGAILTTIGIDRGRCLFGTVPDFCSNENVADPQYKGNYQLMLNWLSTSKKPIYFDEKCHGYSSGNNVFFFILRSPVGFVLLQLIILLAVAFVSLNQRFGPPIVVTNARKISNLEFINGLATSYQRARARDTAWAMIYGPFKARLCKALGVAPHESPEVLAEAWSEESGKNGAECRDFLVQAQKALDKGHIDDNELTKLVQACDRLGSEEKRALAKISGA